MPMASSVLLPQLVELPAQPFGLWRAFQHQRLAVGLLAPAVAVAVGVAVQVQQGLGARPGCSRWRLALEGGS
jgi:hypothetical protein